MGAYNSGTLEVEVEELKVQKHTWLISELKFNLCYSDSVSKIKILAKYAIL